MRDASPLGTDWGHVQINATRDYEDMCEEEILG